MNIDLVSRLAAANPVPAPAPVHESRRTRMSPRRAIFALAVATAVAVPAVTFAGDIGGLLGISNQGTPVATSSLSLSHHTGLAQAMAELKDPATMHLLGTLNGSTFYAAQRPDGVYCFAIDSGDAGKGFGCTALSPTPGMFPSPQKPIFFFPPASVHLVGFAADGVASVAAVDADGAVLETVPVSDNIFAGPPVPDDATAVEALDANGNVLATEPLHPNS
jgi:hypothetical protein